MSIWKPAVDSVLRRYNDPAQREEAGAAAVILLQAMATMGVFAAASVVPTPLIARGAINRQVLSSDDPFKKVMADALAEPQSKNVRPAAPGPSV